MIFFRSPELRDINITLKEIRDELRRIADVMEREPTSEVKSAKWTHDEPTEE